MILPEDGHREPASGVVHAPLWRASRQPPCTPGRARFMEQHRRGDPSRSVLQRSRSCCADFPLTERRWQRRARWSTPCPPGLHGYPCCLQVEHNCCTGLEVPAGQRPAPALLRCPPCQPCPTWRHHPEILTPRVGSPACCILLHRPHHRGSCKLLSTRRWTLPRDTTSARRLPRPHSSIPLQWVSARRPICRRRRLRTMSCTSWDGAHSVPGNPSSANIRI